MAAKAVDKPEKRAEKKAEKKADLTPEQTGQVEKKEPVREFYSRSYSIREEQYDDLLQLAAYNKIMGQKPNDTNSIVREALDMYFASLGDVKYWRI
ncbi:MAG: hypothetical protein FWF30_03075 [Coriobacteriia bacterium]|nr:hypothetical protein [Coriobacteriia bacterium]